jgi:hypothetical protein
MSDQYREAIESLDRMNDKGELVSVVADSATNEKPKPHFIGGFLHDQNEKRKATKAPQPQERSSTFEGRMLHEQYDGNGRPRYSSISHD